MSDAYDGAYRLTVASASFPCPSSAALVEQNGRQLRLGTGTSLILQIVHKVFVPDSGSFARYLEVISNPTDVARTVTVRVDSNLGSNSRTRVVVRPADTGFRYYVTDNQGTCCDPAVAHVVGGGTAVAPTTTGVVDGNDQISTSWRVTVPPHGTIILMHFAVQRGFADAAGAQVEADLLSTLSDPLALSGLTAAELSGTEGDDIDASRIVVVAAADAADAPALRASRIEWPQERVYVDVAGDFATRLRLHGVPVIVGLVGDEVRWRWSGALPQTNLRSLLASWLASHPAPALTKRDSAIVATPPPARGLLLEWRSAEIPIVWTLTRAARARNLGWRPNAVWGCAMDPLGTLIATDQRRTLEFFFLGLRDLCDATVDRQELLYNASILAHYAQVSTDAAEGLPTPADLAAVFDGFVLGATERHDGELIEAAGAQCLLLAGFFEDQMRRRHNIRWYAELGAAFFGRAALREAAPHKAWLLTRLASRFEPWRQRHAQLSRELRDQAYLLSLPRPPRSSRVA